MRLAQTMLCGDANRIIKFRYITADFLQFRCYRLQMLRDNIFDQKIPSGGRCSHHVCAGLNHIRNNRVICAVKRLHTANTNHIGTGALDIRTHAVQEVGCVNHVRLPRRVLNDGVASGKSRCHHDIDGGSDRNHIHKNMRAVKILCLRNDNTMPDLHAGTQRTESLQMLIDRAASDIAASRKRNLRMLVLPEKRSQKIIRRSNLLDIFIIHTDRTNGIPADSHRVAVKAVNGRANNGNCVKQYINITYVRHILNGNRIICHYCSCKYSKRSIFGSSNLYFSDKRIASLDYILIHSPPRYFRLSYLP